MLALNPLPEAFPATPRASRTTPHRALDDHLDRGEIAVVEFFVRGVLREIPAPLLHATLFGSRARGDARADSDLDVLLIFARLPADREPHATQAEDLAAEVRDRTGVPLTVWSVALIDLVEGERTPMLVDALTDSVQIWSRDRSLEPVRFTPRDALRCTSALLQRVSEGSEEFVAARTDGDLDRAARRVRDDLVRMCTALLLLNGITRPRRSEAIAAAQRLHFADAPASLVRVLDWARLSFGPEGRDEEGAVSLPPGGLDSAARVLDRIRSRVRFVACRLADGAGG